MAVLFAAAGALCMLALLPMPYGYYTFLRFVVCGAAGLGAYLAFDRRAGSMWTAMLGIVAVLFNPVVPIHLTRAIWAPVDVVVAVIFGAAAIFLANRLEGDRASR